MIRRFPEYALRTLDALHLAIAARLGATSVTTTDRVMAGVVQALGWELIRFGVG